MNFLHKNKIYKKYAFISGKAPFIYSLQREMLERCE